MGKQFQPPLAEMRHECFVCAHLIMMLVLIYSGGSAGPTTRRGRETAAVDYREPSLAEILAATAAEVNNKDASKDAEEVEVGAEFSYERDKRVVENEATKLGKHWVVNNRGLWARLTGRFRLPQDVAKRAARQCVPRLCFAQGSS
jgi:hypothetical protein